MQFRSRATCQWARRGVRGGTSAEYVIVLLVIAAAGMVAFKLLGKTFKSKLTYAVGRIRCMAGGSCPAGSGACFVAGTLVLTESGLRPIESIEVGMRVLARSEEGETVAWKPVLRTFRRRTAALVEL